MKVDNQDLSNEDIAYIKQCVKDRKTIDTGRFKLVFNSNDFPKFENMEVNFNEVEKVKIDEN